jgi:hypothetical protein
LVGSSRSELGWVNFVSLPKQNIRSRGFRVLQSFVLLPQV